MSSIAFAALGALSGVIRTKNLIEQKETQKEILYELKKINNEIPISKNKINFKNTPLRIVSMNGVPCQNEWYCGIERK